MRHLPSLLTAVLLIAVAYACSSPSGSDTDEFEPYRVGSFMIVEPEKAEYVGLQKTAKQKGDTTYVSSPDGNGLTLENDTTETAQFYTIYVDSSITMNNFDGYYEIGYSNFDAFSTGGWRSTVSEDRMKIEIHSSFRNKGNETDGTINITTFNDDSTHFKTIIIETNKMVDAVEDITN